MKLLVGDGKLFPAWGNVCSCCQKFMVLNRSCFMMRTLQGWKSWWDRVLQLVVISNTDHEKANFLEKILKILETFRIAPPGGCLCQKQLLYQVLASDEHTNLNQLTRENLGFFKNFGNFQRKSLNFPLF